MILRSPNINCNIAKSLFTSVNANEKFIETNASLQHRSNEHVLQYQQQNHAINTYHGNLRFCACVYPAETSLN